MDAEELENLKKENEDKAVEIIDFVKLEEIDPIYFEKSYFMSPDTSGTKAILFKKNFRGFWQNWHC